MLLTCTHRVPHLFQLAAIRADSRSASRACSAAAMAVRARCHRRAAHPSGCWSTLPALILSKSNRVVWAPGHMLCDCRASSF